jgi:Flp pilus assembly pilin Flp
LLVKWARHKFTGKDDTGATLVEYALRPPDTRRRGDEGATLVEYALLLSLVAGVSASGFAYLGKAMNRSLGSLAAEIICPPGDDPLACQPPGNNFQIVAANGGGGDLCSTDPCTITAQGAGGPTFTAVGAVGSVTFSYPSLSGVGYFSPGNSPGSSQLHLTGYTTPPEPVTISATDSEGDTGTLTFYLTVVSAYDPTVSLQRDGCDPTLDSCSAGYHWLDGLYIFESGQWYEISQSTGPGQIEDTQAFKDGTGADGSGGPWTCSPTQVQGGYCTQLSTNAPQASPFALASI